MLKRILVPMGMILSLSFSQLSFAAEECKTDKDCKDGNVCILAMNPPVCKPPQAAGAACKRDVVCASKQCDMSGGKDVGVCK